MVKQIIIFAAIVLSCIEPSLAIETAETFDVEAATRAYLDTLQGEALEKSNSYFEGGNWLILWTALIALTIDWLFLKLGWSKGLGDIVARRTNRVWLQPALYILPYALIVFLITLPWEVYADFIREKSYDLLDQNFGEWLTEQFFDLTVYLFVVSAPQELVGIRNNCHFDIYYGFTDAETSLFLYVIQ